VVYCNGTNIVYEGFGDAGANNITSSTWTASSWLYNYDHGGWSIYNPAESYGGSRAPAEPSCLDLPLRCPPPPLSRHAAAARGPGPGAVRGIWQ
jgi:hypothetical protein